MSATTAPSQRTPEDVWYYLSNEWYKGRQPWFHDTSQLPGTKVLEENWQVIKEELEAYYAAHAAELKPNFTPYAYSETGWKTVNLFSYFLRYEKNCRALPRTTEIVERIPDMCLAQVAVLEPHTRIKAHIGDCNGVIRSHLGLRVPGGLPELGIKVGRESRTWEEGKVLALSIAHRHYAWNQTDRPRIVLVVDTIHPDFHDRRYEVAGNALAAIAMKVFATRFPALKRMPRWLTRTIHAVLGRLARARLWLQRTTGL
ncbi:MAG: aspartyl/asparaginyl beta-hydroxylase domain-containing protein [Myxococcota bacterium]